jgi:hypothetical protein
MCFHLSTNGVEILVGRRVFDAGANGIELRCSACECFFEPDVSGRIQSVDGSMRPTDPSQGMAWALAMGIWQSGSPVLELATLVTTRSSRFTRVSDGNDLRRLLETSKAGQVVEIAVFPRHGTHSSLARRRHLPGPPCKVKSNIDRLSREPRQERMRDSYVLPHHYGAVPELLT